MDDHINKNKEEFKQITLLKQKKNDYSTHRKNIYILYLCSVLIGHVSSLLPLTMDVKLDDSHCVFTSGRELCLQILFY